MARDKRFHIEDTDYDRDIVEQGETLLGIAHKAMSSVKFLGTEDMYCVGEAIDLIERAMANRDNLRYDWVLGWHKPQPKPK